MRSKLKMTTDIPASITTPDSVGTRLGTLTFFDGLPDEETVQTVYDNLDFQSGVQAFLAALPAADICAVREGYRSFGPDNQTLFITESLMDSRTLYSVRSLRPARRVTGSRRRPARGGSPSCGSTARSSPGSTRPGGRGRSSWSIEADPRNRRLATGCSGRRWRVGDALVTTDVAEEDLE